MARIQSGVHHPSVLLNNCGTASAFATGETTRGTWIAGEFSYLAELEWLWLGGNDLSGCVPAGLEYVAENDLGRLGLGDC